MIEQNNEYHLSSREMESSETELIADYWTKSDNHFLKSMGIEPARMPERSELIKMLIMQLKTPMIHKRSFCMIWQMNKIPIGHCNVNPMQYGEQATMHLHLWNPDTRKRGMGLKLVQLTLPHFFDKLRLKKLICEPYALNPAPNNTLKKAGFRFVKEYTTIPGSINFEQQVNRWEMTKGEFEKLCDVI